MITFINRLKNFYVKLVTNNTGVSTRSFMLIWGAMYAMFITLHFMFFDYISTFTEYQNDINYYGWAAVLGGISAVILAVVWGKSKSDTYSDYNSNNYYDNNTTDYKDHTE